MSCEFKFYENASAPEHFYNLQKNTQTLSSLENGSHFNLLREWATEKLVRSEGSLMRFHDRLCYT